MAQLSTTTRDILDKSSLPEFQKAGLGTSLYEAQAGQLYSYSLEKTADFSTASALFTAPFAMQIVDVIVEALATSANGTVKVLKATDEIATAIACAVDGAVTHLSAGATAATKSRRALAAGNVVNIQAAGDAAGTIRGRVTVLAVRV
jgi:hypothetical protein